MSETIGKGALVEALAKKTGSSKAAAQATLEALIDEIQTNVKRGNRVTITGFGTFLSRKRAARKGHNPATGKPISIKASTVPAFKAGAGFKTLVAKAK